MQTANDSNKARRPVIGLMTGSFHNDYSRLLTEAICRRLKAANMDVCLFQGLNASRFLNIAGYVDKGFDRHYYSHYEYSRFVRPDVIVASFGTISAAANPLPLAQFRAMLPEVPIIVLEINEEISGGVCISLDNYAGMCSCVEHLITEHGCRQICFVTGPDGVPDAEQRTRAYRDTMRRHGLPAGEERIFHGDFTDNVESVIEELLAAWPKPDAIVCSNDEMAECAYRVLRAHGLRPGTDVAVTGFDDNLFARQMDPPLTSVCQPKEKLADYILQDIKAMLRAEAPASVTLPAELVLRQSCGCAAPESKGPGQELRQPGDATEDRERIRRLSYGSILVSLMLRNLLDRRITVHSFFRRLGEVLGMLGAKFAWIAMLDEPMEVPDGCIARLPDRLRLHLLVDDGGVRSWSRKDAPVLTASDDTVRRSLWPTLSDDENIALFPLFYANTHYGIYAVKLSLKNMLYAYTISLQIGTALRYLFMALDEQEARAALEEMNQILDFSASHDALTGLYNRVGVVNQIYEYLRGHGLEERYVAVMADLDHLKQINDSFGHYMGDEAIRMAAELLREALPAGAPLGRAGGDEFMAVFRADSDSAPEDFYRRVKAGCAACNARAETPFYEDISVGCCLFELRKGADVRAFFKQADEALYRDKAARRSSVIREKI